MISLATPLGSQSGGQPVIGKATFTTAANQVTILLENLRADPRSAAQCLSGLQFALSTGQNSATLKSSFGIERTINSNDTYTDGPQVSTGWALSTVGSNLKVSLLGTQTAPEHLIVGPPNASNLYPGANPSITNSAHNPLLGQSATFVLDVPGVTAASTISSAVFQFNTAAGNNVPVVPEPALAMALPILVGARRRRRIH